MKNYVKKIEQIASHRNGVSGVPFWVVGFSDSEHGAPMIGVVFDHGDGTILDESGYCAVFRLDLLAKGDIAFGSNSWRGDRFEPELREAIAKHEGSLVED